MYNLLLDLYSQKHLVSSEICQTVFDMFLNPSTITEQISLFRNIFSFTTGSTSFGFMPVGIFFYFTQIVKCLHLLTTHWALSFDYYIRLCDFICEFSHQYEKNSYGVSFHVTHKKSLLVLLQNLLPCLCTIIQNDFKQFMEKKHDLESRLTFDSITLSKATRLTKGIVALTSSYEAIAFEPYHEDHTSIRLQKESCGEEEEIILKIQTYTEQFCYETYQWFLTIRKTVSDFSVTSLKQVTYANSANLSLLYLLESLTLQWNSLNLFCMNFWIPNLQEKTLNSLCLFQCVNTKGYQ
ncbi:uncharacterized protein LOC128883579 [Hylaeus volcanicus]|uniref:uncharacterized protein LOC128883579 n=1 Tax=Hylaeus volcanicus TaxID=313075 RepID=UPI0023B7D069|nr:uncharacterized protein LOC128883579 [Hylaeus volcanicus]